MTPVLSICIPTHNRCGYLYFTLKSIVEQSCFKNTNDVEIVVSDNCSDDSTETIVKIFKDRYPDKIIYSKNETNISDKNFEKALSIGTGKVLKLHNDNFLFEDGAIEKIVNKIKELETTRPMIFFANGNSPLNRDALCVNMDEFIQGASYLATWIAAFSIWKEDFDNFEGFAKNAETHLIQNDVLYNMASNGKSFYIYNEVIFYGNTVLKRGGGNIAKIWGDNYLSLLKPYLEKGLISKKTYEQDKKTLLLDLIIPMKFYSSIKDTTTVFINDGYNRHLLKNYWYNLYYYLSIFKIAKLALSANINKLGQKLFKNSYKKTWKKRNRNNDTTIEKDTDITKVFVGKNVKGHIKAVFTENPREILIIDDDTVIEEGKIFDFSKENLIIYSNEKEAVII